MKVRYFVADQADQLRPVPARVVEDIWCGNRPASQLPVMVGDELRMVAVLCDEDLHPRVCYLSRLNLIGGAISRASRVSLLEAVTEGNRRNFDHPAVLRQLSCWPVDWQPQLAVALDVPAAELANIGVGGPLPLSELLGVPLRKLLRYFEEAFRA